MEVVEVREQQDSGEGSLYFKQLLLVGRTHVLGAETCPAFPVKQGRSLTPSSPLILRLYTPTDLIFVVDELRQRHAHWPHGKLSLKEEK